MHFPTRSVLPGVVAAVLLASGTAACTYKNSDTASGGRAAPDARTGGGAELVDGSRTKVALVPGGAHPYFQPWKAAGTGARKTYGLGAVTFDETAEWDQQKQNNLLSTLAARGYNAFGVFGVSPTDINIDLRGPQVAGLRRGVLGVLPRR